MKINSALPENHPEHLKVDEKKKADIDISLRDWFAGKALQSLMLDHDARVTFPQAIAGRAYVYADAMLIARKGGEA